MKRAVFKTVSLVVAAVMVFSFVPESAAETDISEMFEVYHIENTPSDGYGVINYRFVDENGNEVDFNSPPNNINSSGSGMFTLEDSTALPFVSASSLPSAYNAMDEGYVTPVKNQGNTNNCWAYSAISMLESDSIIKGYETLETADYSESHLAWFSGRSLTDNTNDLAYGDGRSVESPYSQGGNWKVAAATLSRWSGVANEEYYPSYSYDFSAMSNYTEADRYNKSAGIVLESAQVLRDFQDVKQWISDHGSVSAMFHFDTAYYSSAYRSCYCSEALTPNHQITVIGWDDNFSASKFRTKASGNGAWLCKNSWGTDWGNNGCFWISYYDQTISNVVGFTGMQSEDYYKNYTYNGSEYENAYGIGYPVSLANVFKASGNEKLSSVAFYTLGTDVDVTISVYKNLKSNYSTPAQGTRVYNKQMIIERQGYHTIHLDNEIQLNPNEIFSVIVRVYNTNLGKASFPAESEDHENSVYACRTKESYLSVENGSSKWYTAESQGFKNFYIQAFTKCDHQIESKTDGLTCTEDGTETVYCKQCGKIESEKTVFHSGHSFSKWSQFAKDSNGEEISIRTCQNCDLTEKRQLAFMNVVTVPDIIEMFFRNIINFIKQLCI